VSAADAEALVQEVTALLAAHRVWERFPAVSARS
jgi:catalase